MSLILCILLRKEARQIRYNIFFIADNKTYIPSVEGNAGLGRILFHLVEGTGSERVRTYETRLPVLLLVIVGQLRPMNSHIVSTAKCKNDQLYMNIFTRNMFS